MRSKIILKLKKNSSSSIESGITETGLYMNKDQQYSDYYHVLIIYNKSSTLIITENKILAIKITKDKIWFTRIKWRMYG